MRAGSSSPAPAVFTSVAQCYATIYTFSGAGDITTTNAAGFAAYYATSATKTTLSGSGTTWPALLVSPSHPDSAWFSAVIARTGVTVTTTVALTALPTIVNSTTLNAVPYFSTVVPAGIQCSKSPANSTQCVVFEMELPPGIDTTPISGSAGIVLGASGTLSSAINLAGSTGLAFGASGTLQALPADALHGSAGLSLGASGTLRADVALAGTASAVFGVSGTLKSGPILVGAASITFGASGTLTADQGTRFYDLFAAYYTAKQLLLNQMLDVARVNTSDAVSSLQGQIDAAKAEADAANAELARIANDGVLSKAEKTIVMRDESVLMAERSGINIQADAFGVTTEKTAYNNALDALSAYLATLTSPTAWDDLSGDTDINGTTFRDNFASAYTSRQALLNAIYAAAKAKADQAQQTADLAQSLASQVAVLNPGFDAGDVGWAKEGGWSIRTDNTSPGVGPGYAQHDGSVANQTAALRNNAICFVIPGQSYKVAALIEAIGANGSCSARISWRNSSDVEIGLLVGNGVTGNTTTGSYITGVAPAGAVFAHAEVAAYNHTTGTYKVDNVTSSLSPATADEISEGVSRKWAGESGATVGADWQSNLRNGPQAVGSNLMLHGDFATDVATPGVWSSDGTLGINYPSGTPFARALRTSGRDAYETNNWIPVKPGEVLFCSGYFAAGSTALQFGANFRDKAGTNTWAAAVTRSAGSGWGYLAGSVTVPSGCVTARPWLSQNITAGSNSSTGYAALLDIQRSALAQSGSGYRLGDQGNAPSSLTSSLGMVRSAIALTASSTGSVNVNAHTVTYGPRVVSYNAVTNAVTGLTQGSSYYIYTLDNGLGGSPTWLSTTSSLVANGYDNGYNAGYVTIPTSGTSGGGGDNNTCVCADMWLWPVCMPLRLTAGDLAKRWRWWKPWLWWLRGPDGLHMVRRRPRIVPNHCVRIVVADGSHLDCSDSTPVTTQTGESILAPDLFGHLVATDSGWQRVIDVVVLEGLRDVVRICVGGNSFFASADGYRFIASHNAWKP